MSYKPKKIKIYKLEELEKYKTPDQYIRPIPNRREKTLYSDRHKFERGKFDVVDAGRVFTKSYYNSYVDLGREMPKTRVLSFDDFQSNDDIPEPLKNEYIERFKKFEDTLDVGRSIIDLHYYTRDKIYKPIIVDSMYKKLDNLIIYPIQKLPKVISYESFIDTRYKFNKTTINKYKMAIYLADMKEPSKNVKDVFMFMPDMFDYIICEDESKNVYDWVASYEPKKSDSLVHSKTRVKNIPPKFDKNGMFVGTNKLVKYTKEDIKKWQAYYDAGHTIKETARHFKKGNTIIHRRIKTRSFGRKYSKEDIAEWQSLYDSGILLKNICSEYNIPKHIIYKYIKLRKR